MMLVICKAHLSMLIPKPLILISQHVQLPTCKKYRENQQMHNGLYMQQALNHLHVRWKHIQYPEQKVTSQNILFSICLFGIIHFFILQIINVKAEIKLTKSRTSGFFFIKYPRKIKRKSIPIDQLSIIYMEKHQMRMNSRHSNSIRTFVLIVHHQSRISNMIANFHHFLRENK